MTTMQPDPPDAVTTMAPTLGGARRLSYAEERLRHHTYADCRAADATYADRVGIPTEPVTMEAV